MSQKKERKVTQIDVLRAKNKNRASEISQLKRKIKKLNTEFKKKLEKIEELQKDYVDNTKSIRVANSRISDLEKDKHNFIIALKKIINTDTNSLVKFLNSYIVNEGYA